MTLSWALVSDRVVKQQKAVAYESFKTSLIIRKGKDEESMFKSVLKSEIDTAKLYHLFLDQNNPKLRGRYGNGLQLLQI